MKSNTIHKATILGLVLVLLMSLMTGCTGESMTAQAVKIQVETAKKDTMETTMRLKGVLLPSQTVNISSSVTGTVKTIAVEVGDVVKVGDVLAAIDTEILETQILQAQAGIASSQAAYEAVQDQLNMSKINWDKARKDFEDAKVLSESGAVSKSQLDSAKRAFDLAQRQYESLSGAQLNQATAAIETAKAGVEALQIQKKKAQILSPISGVVVSCSTEIGELASTSVPLFTVSEMETLKLIDTVSQGQLPYLSENQEVQIHVDIYPGKAYKGSVSQIGPMAASTGQLFPIEVTLSNSDHLLAGLSASAEVLLAGEGHLVVSSEAVMGTEAAPYVFVIEDGMAHERTVVTGLRNDATVEILSGLEEDEAVAISNTHILQDHMLVEPLN